MTGAVGVGGSASGWGPVCRVVDFGAHTTVTTFERLPFLQPTIATW